MGGKLAIKGGSKVREKAFPAWPQYGKEEAEALRKTLESGVWGVGGKETEDFEKSFAAYQHCRHCVTMVNGSATLRNALIACGVEEGSEVIVPPYTFLATATAVIEANCIPVFADIDPETFCIDPAAIERAVTGNTRAVIPVHIGGLPARMDRIMEIAAKHSLHVIEDAAHAHGSEFCGRRVGSIGHIGSFSFQSSKNLCCGEGGAVTTNDSLLAEKCWSLRNCGRVRGGAWYGHETLGGNYRLSQFQAAVLGAQMKRMDAQIEAREANAAYLRRRLEEIPGVKLQRRDNDATRHSYHLYLLRYDKQFYGGAPRAKFLEAVAAEGLPISPGYEAPLYTQPLFRKMNFGPFQGWRRRNPKLDYGSVCCEAGERLAYEEGCWLYQSVLLGARKDMDEIVDIFVKVYENREELLS